MGEIEGVKKILIDHSSHFKCEGKVGSITWFGLERSRYHIVVKKIHQLFEPKPDKNSAAKKDVECQQGVEKMRADLLGILGDAGDLRVLERQLVEYVQALNKKQEGIE